MRTKNLIFMFGVFAIGCTSLHKLHGYKVSLEEVKLYSNTVSGGFTTAGAYTHFNELKTEGVNQVALPLTEVKHLEEILNEAKRKRHYQTKHGANLIFALVQFSNGIEKNRFIIGFGIEVAIITDLTNMVDYIVENENNIKWLRSFDGLL